MTDQQFSVSPLQWLTTTFGLGEVQVCHVDPSDFVSWDGPQIAPGVYDVGFTLRQWRDQETGVMWHIEARDGDAGGGGSNP